MSASGGLAEGRREGEESWVHSLLPSQLITPAAKCAQSEDNPSFNSGTEKTIADGGSGMEGRSLSICTLVLADRKHIPC